MSFINSNIFLTLKKLRHLMNYYKKFNMTRDNRNPGGEKVSFMNCYIINDGENGKSSLGTKNARIFSFRANKTITEERAY
ncbi:MAG: hypothetical protein SOY68_08380 [Fusobacterium varium]|nr:hypothetical protein [Fusobacterium varium]